MRLSEYPDGAAIDGLVAAALRYLASHGIDTKGLMERAARNLDYWHDNPAPLPPENVLLEEEDDVEIDAAVKATMDAADRRHAQTGDEACKETRGEGKDGEGEEATVTGYDPFPPHPSSGADATGLATNQGDGDEG